MLVVSWRGLRLVSTSTRKNVFPRGHSKIGKQPIGKRSQPLQKKSLGQVFLREDWPCTKIVDFLKKAGVTSVIEIGPGAGILTKALLKAGIKVLAVEKDTRFADRLQDLRKVIPGAPNLTVANLDILKFDLRSWLNCQDGPLAICGNIPYNISSSVIQWFMPHLDKLKLAMIMTQLEFGERLTSAPSRKQYGSLSVYTQLRAKVKLEFRVGRSCFAPVPGVDSAVLSFYQLQKKTPNEILQKVETISKQAFSQRRKQLHNSLARWIPDLDQEILQIDLSRRCDSLSPVEFVQLAKAISWDHSVGTSKEPQFL